MRFVGILLLLVASSAFADVALPALFSDHAVLQGEAKIPVWGTAGIGEVVTVTLGDRQANATGDANGAWRVALDPPAVGGPYTLVVKGNNTITVNDVVVGDVWLCSGQSNMEWKVAQAANADVETAAANYPLIRQFTIQRAIVYAPLQNATGKWVVCSPATVRNFSAVGYYFARELHKNSRQPVGILFSAVGGTPIESWMSIETLKQQPESAVILPMWEQHLKNYSKTKQEYDTITIPAWQKTAAAAKAAGTPEPPKPRIISELNYHQPAVFWNGMIAPLVGYGIRGVAWYQGESNVDRAWQYRQLFPALIKEWRTAWNSPELPFLYVQIAPYKGYDAPRADVTDSDYAELREAQSMALVLPKTAMVVTTDIGDANNIHPSNKQSVGERLALAARNLAGEKIIATGPQYAGMAIEDNCIRLSFTGATGLHANNGELTGFYLAGYDRKFFPAKAIIDGETILVSCKEVVAPVAVRYGWANAPTCNLANGANLPASPFRTDEWPGITVGKLAPVPW